MVCAWGLVIVAGADGGVACLREKPLAAKLELLHAKSLYVVALNLAQSEQARAAPAGAAPREPRLRRRGGLHEAMASCGKIPQGETFPLYPSLCSRSQKGRLWSPPAPCLRGL